MSESDFQFRLRSSHPAPDRATQDLAVEYLDDSGEWQPQQLSLTMPGFRRYLISLLLCQHFYLVVNAREKAIPLEQMEGDFRIRLDAAASEQERALADADAIAKPESVRKGIALTSVS